MNGQLKHIFDDSACLTRRQIKDYVSGAMSAEECHAAEHHINCCPFCSEAVEGMAGHEAEAVAAVSELNTAFLIEHFNRNTPQVHLNSLAPATSSAGYTHTRTKAQKEKAAAALRNTSIGIVVLLGVGVIGYWAFEKGRNLQSATVQPSTPVQVNTPIVNQPVATQPAVNPIRGNEVPGNNKPNDKQQKVHPLILTNKSISTAKKPAETILNGTDLYSQGNWPAALASFQQQMAIGNKRQRHEATIMAAHCYQHMGANDKAQALLQTIVNDGGPKKGNAKRMLRKMDNSQE